MPTRIVVLEDAHLARLAQIPANVERFPLLRAATRSRAGGCCSGSSDYVDLSASKAAVAGLPPDKLAEFKRLLDTTLIRVIYRGGIETKDVTV